MSLDSERKRIKYLGERKSNIKRPGATFCPLCKSEIDTSRVNNRVKVYLYQPGEKKSDMPRPYKVGRLCANCGIICTLGSNVEYESTY